MDIDEWQLVEYPHDSKIAEQSENTENKTSLSNCDPLPKTLQKANPCDNTNESNNSHINKKEGQHSDLNKVLNIQAAFAHLLIVVPLHNKKRTMNFVESSSLMLMIFCGLEMRNLNDEFNHCRKLSGRFQAGKNSVQAFKYVSVNIVQHNENITLDQTDYISSIQSIQIFHDYHIENNNLQICKQQFTEY